MTLLLKQSRAIAEIAELLYSFLPGSGNSNWKGHVTFKTVAEKVGVGDFWQPGSKIPMITGLLEHTLDHRRSQFEPLILEIIRASLIYRQKQGNSVTPEEIDKLNGLIVEVGFKFPDLWDPDFKASLRADGATRAKEHVEQALIHEQLRVTQCSKRISDLTDIKKDFFALHEQKNRQDAGIQFETILNRLFELHELSPREPFRVTGEQIDGSFELDHEVYLLEAKWQQDPTSENDLLVFRGKIEGKSKYTRGVFVTINGLSQDAAEAITQGKQPSFFVMNGHDITMLLEDNMSLTDFLRKRQRLLAEEGRVVLLYSELLKRIK